ncbi:MAG: HrcA family transcriptional regulator [Patescibacteria group bacterium]|jgi:heat-inducible transcriptional repressor
MANLDERQTKILKAIVEEYINTALPVGSNTIEKKYNLGVSPATIRNEMVKLTEQGFLKKVHTSSGRVPSPTALKYYVNNLMKEQQLSLAEEVSVKEKVWDYRHEMDKLLREMTRELAARTKELAVATTDEGNLYAAGMSNILESPEFFDIDLTKALLAYLDEVDFWQNLINRSPEGETVGILLGSDLGSDLFEPCGFVYRKFEVGPRKGVIGVVGPARLNYGRVYPTIKYFGQLIDEILENW